MPLDTGENMLAGSCVDPDEQHIGGAVHVAAGRGEVTTTTTAGGQLQLVAV